VPAQSVHVPPLQHAPLHDSPGEHDIVHAWVVRSQASPMAQSVEDEHSYAQTCLVVSQT